MSNSAGSKKDKINLNYNPLAKPNSWAHVHIDLENAMNKWRELDKLTLVLSPEEEEFIKIKSLIAQLKEKLQQF